jgi:hypothetical protein
MPPITPDGEPRRIGVDTEYSLKTCNNIADFNKDDIDYSYYVAAAKKLLINNTSVDQEVAAYL